MKLGTSVPIDKSKYLGNAEDGWIWKGKHPQSTPVPVFEHSGQIPFTTNRLPVNQSAILSNLDGGESEPNEYGSSESEPNEYGSSKSEPNEYGSTVSVPQDHWIWLESNETSRISSTSPEKMTNEAFSWFAFNFPVPRYESKTELWLHNSTVPFTFTDSESYDTRDSLRTETVQLTTSTNSLPGTGDLSTLINTTIAFLTNYSDNTDLLDTTEYPTEFLSGAVVFNSSNTNYENYSVVTISIVCVLLILLFLSIISNSLIIFTILCRHYLRQTFYILYVSLAASNLFATVASVPVLIVAILYPNFQIPELCMFITAALILTTFISVGSIASISAIRWWQFYNFIQTRTHEKMVIRLLIFGLWAIGLGIILGYISQNELEIKSTCSLNLITATLQKTFPVTAVAISSGSCAIITVNYLAISKIKKKSIYKKDNQLSPMHNSVCFSRVTGQVNSKANECRNNQSDGKYSAFVKPSLPKGNKERKESPQNKYKTSCVFNTMVKKPDNCKSLQWDNMEHDPSTSIAAPEYSGPKISQKGTVKSNYSTLKQPNGIMTTYESEPESEHLYQVIEPQDTQEHFSLDQPSAIHKKLESFVLPNAVENIYNSPEATWKHETTIALEAPPANSAVNVNAWKTERTIEGFLPQISFRNEVNELQRPAKANIKSQENLLNESTNMLNPWPLLQSPLTNGQSGQFKCENSPCFQVDKFREVPNSSQEFSLPTSFQTIEIQDSVCPGYMADLSASSSKHSTPHMKNRKKRASKNSKLFRNSPRQGSNIESDEDDQGNEIHKFQRTMPMRNVARSNPYQSSSEQAGNGAEKMDLKEVKIMPPVRQKCVGTSQRLIVLYLLAYLPLLVLQATIYIMGLRVLVLITLLYMVFLLAIHASLHVLQSPILKNAIFMLIRRIISPNTNSHVNEDLPFSTPIQVFPIPHVTQQITKDNCTHTSTNKNRSRPCSAPYGRPKLAIPPEQLTRPSSYHLP